MPTSCTIHCAQAGCRKTFTRRDSLKRHLLTHAKSEKKDFACFQCLKYQGDRAFSRKDHLNQHIRNVHKQTPYQCPVDGCGRFGAKGWFSKYHRNAHQQDEHGDVDGDDLVFMNEAIDAMVPEWVSNVEQ